MKKPCIIKVGGSLYNYADFPKAFTKLITCMDCPVVVLGGGGDIVDSIRRLHQVHGLSEKVSHWMAIYALDLTGHILLKLLPDAVCWENPHRPPVDKKITILMPSKFCKMDAVRNPMECIPETWDATSDSLSVRVATAWGFDTLILCKAASVEPHLDWKGYHEAGVIDGLFEGFVSRLGAPSNVSIIKMLT